MKIDRQKFMRYTLMKDWYDIYFPRSENRPPPPTFEEWLEENGLLEDE